VIGGVTSSLHQPGAYGSFAALALLLANIGIYGVRRRSIQRRRHFAAHSGLDGLLRSGAPSGGGPNSSLED
jgi:hypothetical protein